MSLVTALRASKLSQPDIVTEIRYSRRRSIVSDHAMIMQHQRNTRLPHV